MEPLIVLVVATGCLRAAGAARADRLRSWHTALRGGLAAMFLLTGTVHFVGMRAEFIEMVPPALPSPGLIITLTGVLELAGAAGLVLSRTAPWAAGGLTLLLVAMFPANVYAALAGVTTSAVDELLPRTLMQLVFLSATVAVAAPYVRAHRRARHPAPENVSLPSLPGRR